MGSRFATPYIHGPERTLCIWSGMADTFTEVGLSSELVRAAESNGYAVPTALQRAAIPVLRRGGNAVLHASTGAGVVGAYGLALLDRLAALPAADAPAGPLAL